MFEGESQVGGNLLGGDFVQNGLDPFLEVIILSCVLYQYIESYSLTALTCTVLCVHCPNSPGISELWIVSGTGTALPAAPAQPDSHRSVQLVHGGLAGVEEDYQDVMDDLKDGDQTAAHGQPQDAPHVGNEPDDGHTLVPLNLGHSGVLDVDVDQGQVLPGILVQHSHQLLMNKLQISTLMAQGLRIPPTLSLTIVELLFVLLSTALSLSLSSSSCPFPAWPLSTRHSPLAASTLSQMPGYLSTRVALLYVAQVEVSFLKRTQNSGPNEKVFKLGNTDVVTAILLL